MKKFAEGTTVPVEKSMSELRKLLMAVKATKFATIEDEYHCGIGFVLNGRTIRMSFAVPPLSQFRAAAIRTDATTLKAREMRRLWRALVLCLKAKLESSTSGISTFEEEFLAFMVMPDGRTVAQHVLPAVEQSLASGRSIPLLALEYEATMPDSVRPRANGPPESAVLDVAARAILQEAKPCDP